MRFPLSRPGNNLCKSILTCAWFGCIPYLFFRLLPELVLEYPLMSRAVAAFLGLALALIIISLLQKHGYSDQRPLLNSSITHSALAASLLDLYQLFLPVMLLSPERQPDPGRAMFLFLLLAVLVVGPLLKLMQSMRV